MVKSVIPKNFPKHLKIKGHAWKISISNFLTLTENCLGHCRRLDQHIVIQNARPVGAMHQSLIHEIIHAIDDKDKLSEDQVAYLAENLYQVLHDNKLHFHED